MEKIATDPGIYKRTTQRGETRYVVTYWIDGKQRRETARTLKGARRIKAARETDRDRGELFEASRLPFRDYAAEWIDRYQGNGRRGFTDATRAEYRRDLERYAYPYFGDKLGRTMAGITPRDMANWIGWLCERRHGKGKRLSDSSVRRILAPVRSCLATAKREGLIRSNPAEGAALPHRPKIEDERDVRAFTREQLDAFLRVVHPRFTLTFEFLVATGLRWSELCELRWSDLRLDGSEPCVRVRRANVKGTIKPPKSKYGRRDIPLDAKLVRELRQRRGGVRNRTSDALVFASERGTVLEHSDVLRRVLRPAAEEAGAAWAGFHTFRHTCASLLFARGKNAKQVQRWLGHHSAAFTLDTYTHLLDDGLGEALDLDAERSRDNVVTMRHAQIDPKAPESLEAEAAI